jgi:hypothetical protein
LKELKGQFNQHSKNEGKTIPREDGLKILRACGQNPSSADYDSALLDAKLVSKANITFEEMQVLATKVWNHDAKPAEKDVKKPKKNHINWQNLNQITKI